jgi:hypothetical protein
MMRSWILLLSVTLVGWFGLLSPLLANGCNSTLFQECGAAGDYACAYVEARNCLEGTNFALVDENDMLLVRGDLLEFTFLRASQAMDPTKARSEAEFLLAYIGQRYPKTVYFWATLHTIRFEACADLAEADCSLESASFLCDNANWLAMPDLGGVEKDEFHGRLMAAMETQCKDSMYE